jgi:hypothetical protein
MGQFPAAMLNAAAAAAFHRISITTIEGRELSTEKRRGVRKAQNLNRRELTGI